MVKVFEGTPEQYYMDGYLKDNLDTAKRIVREDWDVFGVFDGTEGAGKSVLAQQVAKYCDPTLDLSRIVFTPTQFKKAVREAKKYQAIIYDEAYGGLGSRGTMTQVNMTIVKMLTEIRQKNLFLFIVLPSIFDLDKYAAIWRSRFLIHIYADRDFKRGYFAFYNAEQKKLLYLLGKKYYDYNKPRPAFVSNFPNHYTVDELAYKKKKIDSSLNDIDDNRIMVIKTARELRKSVAISLTNTDLRLSDKQLAAILDISVRSINRYLQNYGITDEKELLEEIPLEIAAKQSK